MRPNPSLLGPEHVFNNGETELCQPAHHEHGEWCV